MCFQSQLQTEHNQKFFSCLINVLVMPTEYFCENVVQGYNLNLDVFVLRYQLKIIRTGDTQCMIGKTPLIDWPGVLGHIPAKLNHVYFLFLTNQITDNFNRHFNCMPYFFMVMIFLCVQENNSAGSVIKTIKNNATMKGKNGSLEGVFRNQWGNGLDKPDLLLGFVSDSDVYQYLY